MKDAYKLEKAHDGPIHDEDRVELTKRMPDEKLRELYASANVTVDV